MNPALFFIRRGQEQNTREVKHHVYANGKREFVPRDQVSPFCRLLFIIYTHKLVVSRNFLSIRVSVLSCFYLLIFYFEKFFKLNLTFTICRTREA